MKTLCQRHFCEDTLLRTLCEDLWAEGHCVCSSAVPKKEEKGHFAKIPLGQCILYELLPCEKAASGSLFLQRRRVPERKGSLEEFLQTLTSRPAIAQASAITAGRQE